MRTTKAFTLLEIMVIFAIIGIVVSIAAPTWLRQRELSRQRACQENLSKIEGATETYAAEFRLKQGATISFPEDLIQPAGAAQGDGYLRGTPQCPGGGTYSVESVGSVPVCSISTSMPATPHVPIHVTGL